MLFQHSGPGDGDIPPEAYQLADHLDAALAAAEDLTEAGRAWVPATATTGFELAAQMAAERQVIERVRMFETVLIGRVLKARARAQVLARTECDFAGMTRLFVGGTAALLDAVDELGDSTRADFETGDCHIAYLRQRGVIANDAPDLPENRTIVLGDDQFLVAARIALAPLTQMIIAFLDALDLHYDLYPDDPDGAEPFGWDDVVSSVRNGEALLDSLAHDSHATSTSAPDRAAGLGDERLVADDRRVGELAAATAHGAHVSGDAAPAHLTAGGETAPNPRLPLSSTASTRSLVDRLGEIARALE